MNTQRQKASESVLLLSIQYWLPLGLIDPLMLSYLILAATAFCIKWRVAWQDKVVDRLNRVGLHVNPFVR
jgi:hypothetical protein